ncbi:MAG: bifunctional (p)ppGpp synthetase/guanosine-3',5'-bis(diphosphate) 3'-pyrophosphohydrolase, partial [Bacilli bacterium]|nr:bifunctional (p)ppGpp synthetase/guanosine-3',5'-bis(diphosphate) 3'-pyrophosphohydrolase [Bacilli bacterium]
MIKKAYQYAKEKHEGDKRRTGEDYITHSLNVAYILSTINADSKTIIAGILHDIIEKNKATKEDIEEEFGSDVASLVNGITKINKISFTSATSDAMVTNERKILIGLTEDVRVIFIKLADRLHNMRTLWALPEDRQKAKAKETLDLLIPIAHRLGMNKIKSELEELCLRYLKPDVYFEIVEKLNQSKKERDNLVLEMQKNVSELLNTHSIKHEIKGRAKSIYSIYKKLETGKRFSDIYDLLALRVFVDTKEECYQVLGIIHSKYKPLPKRFKDYVAMPKTNMYQSLHTTVFGIDGHLFEIQIRTYEMDKIAEHGIASHWSYKENKSMESMQNEMEQKLQFFRSIIELKDELDDNFVNSVKEDIFKNTIYVFTPKGDVIELPKGSTPLDFAYKVHSSVGDHCVGAIVNDKVVPLDYKLNDEDIIKINTNKNSNPSYEWINIVKTNQAKNKIKGYFNKIDKEEYYKKGEESLIKELRKRKLPINTFVIDNLDKILDTLKLGDLNELYMAIGNNKFTPSQVINTVIETKKEDIITKTINKQVVIENLHNDIIVDGIDYIKVNLASCCKPIKGDKIIGFITKGSGITVHRLNCPNISNLDERFIDVSWNNDIVKKYPTSIIIYTNDYKNILLDIISKTSNSDITIINFNTLNTNDGINYDITVTASNIDNLNKFMSDIKSIESVLDVERKIL